MKTLSPFSQAVIQTVKKIPRGRVASYGQIAAIAGKPHAARGVSWILHSCSKAHGLPWQRVVNAQGKISFPAGSREAELQQARLQREGVRFSSAGRIDFARWQWRRK